jgi:aldehyde dehydrogenase (NAD(P)+)
MPHAISQQFDWDIATLQTQKIGWAALPLRDKINLLKRVRSGLKQQAEALASLCAERKGVDPRSNMAGDEWVLGPWSAAYTITTLIDSLERILHKRALPLSSTVTRSGQLAVRIFPVNTFERLLVNGLQADVWMQPGITAASLDAHIAPAIKHPPAGKVALVLGAGNVVSIPILDTLHKLYAEGQVVLLKFNPVNDYAGPLIEEIFAPLINAGFVRVAYGGADVGAYLTTHDGIEEIHITGSARTHDAILFGAGEAGLRNKASGTRILNKRITSELGGVCPVIVVPGAWTAADIRFQAENIVSQRIYHNGYNCCASQVLVLPEGWVHGPMLMAEIRRLFATLTPRHPYYPGSQQRADAARAAHPHAESFAPDRTRTLIADCPPDRDQFIFREEAFCPVLAQTALPAPSVEAYLHNATVFCNLQLAGTLSATVLIDPETVQANKIALETALAELRYGSIGVNIWGAGGFMLPGATWGAYPGHTHTDIGSGIGFVHNAYLLDGAQKTIMRGPFREMGRAANLMPKPLWFVTHRRALETARRVTYFSLDPGWQHMPALFMAALRG